jgi:hypothetical protein
MRISFAIPLLMLLAFPNFARSDPSDLSLAATANRDEARWADWEAQARITDGDYDGALQAEQQAEADRHEADRQEMLARSSKR